MSNKINIAGHKFGLLTVAGDVGKDKFGQSLWQCNCECGKQLIVRGGDLRRGKTKSCGCTKRPVLAGERFGRLSAISNIGVNGNLQRLWLCQCDCGENTTVAGAGLRSGNTQSCGCIRRERAIRLGCERKTHGEATTRTPEYYSWSAMKERCLNPRKDNYPRYGGRGILVCDRWREDFEAFLADMGRRPSQRHTLDRIDTNGNYEPDNCQWSTPKQQANNRRRPAGRLNHMET